LISESRLYTLIDEARDYALYFLEGQQLIQDVALVHPIRGVGFAYFRDVVLSVQPMIAFLKHGEQFGFYIDSADPYFRLKIETARHGSTRCMLLPEDFQEFPEAMRGLVRVHKLFPDSPPYESVLKVEGLPLREIVNRVLHDSYQVNCAMLLSEASDQSVFLHQLPPSAGNDDFEYSPEAVRARREQIRSSVRQIFGRALHESEDIVTAFAEIGFRVLAHRPMRFHCSCSREGMVQNVRSVYRREGDSLFDPGADDLEVVCEYCKSRYRVTRVELAGKPHGSH
jgi:molecular chaperone Hsp33